MRLIELQPRWWSAHAGEHDGGHDRHGVTFLCPHCKTQRLGVAFDHSPAHLDLPNTPYAENVWHAEGDTSFETLTLTPSVDASSCGHWHGFITNGEIR
jgi:hypothetical protein